MHQSGVFSAYKYKYNSKEWQDELSLNWYDYGARNYDPAIGRWMNLDPLANAHPDMTPYRYSFNSPTNAADPTGLLEDWVQNGDDFFYDSEVTTQAEAASKYGETAKHLNEGSRLTGKLGNDIAYQYTFHDNGTVSDVNGDVMDTRTNIKTAGGSTIIGSEHKNGFKYSFGLNAAFGGGFGLDIGIVKDAGGSLGFMLGRNANVGFGEDVGFGFGPIMSNHSGPFLLEDAGGSSLGLSAGIESPIGGIGSSYGGTYSNSLSPGQRFNPANYGTSDTGRGNYEVSRGFVQPPAGKLSAGIMYRKSNVTVFPIGN